MEANCNENSEVYEQKTNGDNQLQTTSSFDELINVDGTYCNKYFYFLLSYLLYDES